MYTTPFELFWVSADYVLGSLHIVMAFRAPAIDAGRQNRSKVGLHWDRDELGSFAGYLSTPLLLLWAQAEITSAPSARSQPGHAALLFHAVENLTRSDKYRCARSGRELGKDGE